MTHPLCRVVGLVLVLLGILPTGFIYKAAAQEIKLKLSHFAPVAHNHHANVIVPWVEEVKKRTKGCRIQTLPMGMSPSIFSPAV